MNKKTKKRRVGALSPKPAKNSAPFQKARKLYKQGVLIRGEAAVRDKHGKLPPGATHEIVGGEIVRVRYSLV